MQFSLHDIEKLRGKGPITVENFKKALYLMHGNVTHTAVLLDITKVHAIRLVKKWKLRKFANEQRASIGVSSTGRPTLKVLEQLSRLLAVTE